MNDVPVSITPHRTMSFSGGVIGCSSIGGMTDETVIAELHDQGVIDSRRISVERGGQAVEASTCVLTFSRLQLPEIVNVGYRVVRVERCVPPPLQCGRCLLYGRAATECRRQAPGCARCGEDRGLNECQRESVECFHCSGSRLSFSGSCPGWGTEREIVALKHALGLSFPEARERVQQRAGISCASVAAGSCKSSAAQTELSMSSHALPAPQTSATPGTISQTGSQAGPLSESRTPSIDLSSTGSSPERSRRASARGSGSRGRSRGQGSTAASLSQRAAPAFGRFRPLESVEQDEVSALDSPLAARRGHPPDKAS